MGIVKYSLSDAILDFHPILAKSWRDTLVNIQTAVHTGLDVCVLTFPPEFDARLLNDIRHRLIADCYIVTAPSKHNGNWAIEVSGWAILS